MNTVQETRFQSLEGNQSRMVSSGDNNSLLATNNRRITIKLKIPRTEIVEKEEHSHPFSNGLVDYYVNARPVVNLKESLKGWSVTCKRSQKRHARRGQEEEVDEDMKEAASALLLLAQGPPKDFESVSKKPPQVEVSPDGHGFGSDYGRIFSSEALKIINSSEIQRSRMEKGKKKFVLESKFGSDKSMGLSYDYHEDYYTDVESNKKRKLADHICTICNESFPTHQALGGHKASHNKPKKIQTAKESKSSLDHVWATTEYEKQVSKEVAGGTRVAAVSGVTGVHICNICNEIFPTGMALGGHKRRHWAGPVETLSSSSQETSCPTEVTHTGCKVHDFDLNEPALEEEEDVYDRVIQPVSVFPVEAAATAYASLLHN